MYKPESFPWDRLKRETSITYGLFIMYRDLGYRRKKQKVADMSHNSSEYVYRLARKFHWDDRAEAYDKYIDDQSRQEVIHQAEEVKKATVTGAQLMASKALKKLQVLDIDELSAKEAKEYLRNALAIAETYINPDGRSRDIVDQVEGGGNESSVVIYMPEIEKEETGDGQTNSNQG